MRRVSNKRSCCPKKLDLEDQALAIAPIPKTLDYIHAASVPIVAITAWQSLFDGANLQPGQSVLIHGGDRVLELVAKSR